jgi:hypothetical protein
MGFVNPVIFSLSSAFFVLVFGVIINSFKKERNSLLYLVDIKR